MEEILNKVIDPEEWLNQFNAIDSLRVINKFHPHDLIENLESLN